MEIVCPLNLETDTDDYNTLIPTHMFMNFKLNWKQTEWCCVIMEKVCPFNLETADTDDYKIYNTLISTHMFMNFKLNWKQTEWC